MTPANQVQNHDVQQDVRAAADFSVRNYKSAMLQMTSPSAPRPSVRASERRLTAMFATVVADVARRAA